MQTWVRPGTDSMYKVLGSAGQREEGLEGVGQRADLEEGAGFQLAVKDGSLNFKRTGKGRFSQHSSFCQGTEDPPSQSLILE